MGQSVPLDSVQEFSVLTNNFSAEYGRASGGVVNVATKSGTNDFHGTLYEFNRVSALAANTYNNNASAMVPSKTARASLGRLAMLAPSALPATSSATRSAVRSSRTSCSSSAARSGPGFAATLKPTPTSSIRRSWHCRRLSSTTGFLQPVWQLRPRLPEISQRQLGPGARNH